MKTPRWRRVRQPSDGKTFEEVVSLHMDSLYRTALRLARGHTANAEDLMQDSMLRACEGYGDLREPEAVRAWFFTILFRTHYNRQRSVKRHPEALECDLSEAEFEHALECWPTDGLVSGWPSIEEISLAIDGLDDSLRSVMVLVDVEGFRQREVAGMLHIPEGTVASRLFRARRLLRDALSDEVGRPETLGYNQRR
ncbi:MAG: RNA polymerase sigma factor [Gemmatimonadaceae bacterium]